MANEKRLIVEALKNYHDSKFTPGVYEHSIFGKAAMLLEVDAVEVVHGRWIDGYAMQDGKEVYKSIDCSHCNEIFKTDDREYWKARFKVCPFCGAKMDGGDTNDER